VNLVAFAENVLGVDVTGVVPEGWDPRRGSASTPHQVWAIPL
jgi:hypothetical protein